MKRALLIAALALLAAAGRPAGQDETIPRPALPAGTVIRLSQDDPAGYRKLAEGESGPGILLTFPPVETTVTADPAIRLAGRVEAADEVLVNNQPVRVYPSGSFAALVPLAEGDNAITLDARAGGGKTVHTLAVRRAAAVTAEPEETAFPVPRPGRVSAGGTPLRSLPAGPRILHLPEGVILSVKARAGNWLRSDLGGGTSGWISASGVEMAAGPAPETVRIGKIGFAAESSQAWFPLAAPVPARVDYLSPDELDLVFYQSAAGSEIVDLGGWEGICLPAPSADGIAVFRLRGGLNCHRWSLDWLPGGYRFRWRERPRRDEEPVCLDPGHGGGQRGAVSPGGIAEKDANLVLAWAVAAELRKEGVEVFLTRDGDQTLNLGERTDIARKREAGVFVSLHYNSVGAGRNPLEGSGYTVFYYHPPGRELAGSIHRALAAAGRAGTGVWRRSLAVIRPTDLVTVLVETAYLSHPKDEAEVLDPSVRRQIGRAIAAGILDYLDR